MSSHASESDRAARFYQNAAGREYHEGKRALAPGAVEWVMRLRAEKFQPHVRPADVVVELGVGAGWNLGQLKCARRIGCDASEFLAERLAALGIEFVPALASIGEATADVALCHHTLEHLLDPAGALRELARVLKPDGKLVLHVPWDRERRFANYRLDEPNHHLFTWNAQSIGNLVAALGWRIERIHTQRYGYDRFAANLAARFGLGGSGFRTGRKLMLALWPWHEVELVARHLA
jgi:SAM-dependent methyltransferase